jgi:hypothetical protein
MCKFALLAVLVLLTSCTADIEGPTAEVEGRVVEVEGRVVEVYDPEANPMRLNLMKGVTNYTAYHNEKVGICEDYGIYFEELDSIKVEQVDGVLCIKCSMPKYFSWGNFVSVRKQFHVLKDLSKAEGIQVTYRILSSSHDDFTLRFTFCDHKDRDFFKQNDDSYDADSRQDYMWYYDIEPTIEDSGWVTKEIPFSGLGKLDGEGVRKAPYGSFKPENFNAYEINIVSESALEIELEIGDLRPYSKEEEKP